MPTHNAMIAVKANNPSYIPSMMVMIDTRPNSIRPGPKTYRTVPEVEFLILLFRDSIGSKYPLPACSLFPLGNLLDVGSTQLVTISVDPPYVFVSQPT